MPVTDIPASALDNESDVWDWLAGELVANYHFEEAFRYGSVGANDIQIFLDRAQATTYHNETPITLLLEKYTDTDSGTNKSMSFNLSPTTWEDAAQLVAPQSVTVDFIDSGNGRIQVTAGDFTNWVTAGFSAGDVVRLTDAATSANNGLYLISSFLTTSTTNDTITLNPAAPGQTIDTFDTGDVVTVEGLPSPAAVNTLANVTSGKGATAKWMVGARADEFLWNWGMNEMDNGPYVRGRLVTSPTADSTTPSEHLQFIVILEYAVDRYTIFGFGEAVKIIDDITGAWWASGNVYSDQGGTDIDAEHNVFCQGPASSTTWSENLNQNNAPFAVWAPNYALASGGDGQEYGWGWYTSGGYGSVSFDAPVQFPMGVMPHFYGNGKELIGYSPSAFSGQSERWPITCYLGFGTRNYESGGGGTMGPGVVIPDIFLADITNVDAYSVFQDTFGEKFMVVPFQSKAGSGVGSSEKWGFLIRNPDLTVT